MQNRYTGLFAAVFTPMCPDGSLNPTQIQPIVDYLLGAQISGLYVCGSTGEGPSLSSEERRAVAAAYVEAAAGKLPVVVQVGHNSLAEASALASHAQSIGADAISALPPSYFKFSSLDTLIDCLSEIASAAANLPFFYYHIPSKTGMNFDMAEFLRRGSKRLPNLAGIKYSDTAIQDYQACLRFAPQQFSILFGYDEMLLSALSVGAAGAVGSTYNFAGPLYNRIVKAFKKGDLAEAQRCQALSVDMIRILSRYRSQPAFKAAMKLIGFDCGPNRLPLESLKPDEIKAMKAELDEIGFFDWAMPQE
ncbi:MAG: dihydrodipicolinate synthase family protein [Planctomycetota bacterium]|jgi:N-acetylneuraminate lyase